MISFFTKAVKRWWQADPSTNGAALAYYAIFSLAPIVILLIIIVGKIFGELAVAGKVAETIQGLIGTDASQLVEALIAYSYRPTLSVIAAIISSIVLIVGALGLFTQIEYALGEIWHEERKPRPTRSFIASQVVAIFMVLILGCLVIMSLLIGAIGPILIHRVSQHFGELFTTITITSSLVSSIYILILFTLMYKYLPPVQVSWKAAVVGAVIGGVLFILGRYVLGLYITANRLASVYGAAGALILILMWFYYSAQIFFFGAAVTYTVDQNRKLRQTSL